MDKEKNTTNDNPTTLKQSTGWTPPNSQDQNFDSYRNLTQREILKELDIPPSYRRFNLPKSERQAIKTLANNDKITIKPADKGGKIVIQDTTDYISECERQLENTVHYKRLYTDPTAELNLIIKNKLQQGIKDGHISTEEFEVLYNRDPRTSNFYTLPKIHKINNPGRPIVNSIGSITEKISAYVDENIKYFAKLVPSYIKDTGHFLNIIKTLEIQEEDLLVTVDVSSLYTNIRHQDGIKALKHWLIENGTPIEKAEFIGVLAKLVLTSNYFTFNGKLYLQKQGTAMETRMAPNYAIIFMHSVEEEILKNTTLKPRIWRRFIDDVFIVWTHGKETLEKFLNYINQVHETIKFTAEYSTQEVPFLDTLVYKLKNKLATKVYHKKTDDKMYLHYSSAHPRSQKDAIPYSLFIRCKRICTENRHFNMEVQEITNKLAHRGYPKELIVKSYLKARNQDRDNLLKMDEKPNNQKKKIRLITTYNKHNPPMKEILERFKDYFSQNRKGINFQNIQTVYRRAPNLRDKLIRGQVIKELKLGITSPCNKPCITCPKMDYSNVVTSNTNVSYKIPGKYNCQSRNVVYVLTCGLHNIQYVGETQQTLNARFRLHESMINTKKENPVADHFNEEDHIENRLDFKINVVGQEPNKNRRLRLEEAWMLLLNTHHPNGLNSKW